MEMVSLNVVADTKTTMYQDGSLLAGEYAV